jgi:AraC family transcriptional regulator of adaptative response/methylated-DNA-[protein]-cysteine methyltransferase
MTETVAWLRAESALGPIVLAASSHGLAALAFGSDDAVLSDVLGRRFTAEDREGGDAARGHLGGVLDLIARPGSVYQGQLDLRGTPFQMRVWSALREIPAGARWSYSDIARAIGAPLSVRAVAGACGANRIAVAIPCHRVVRSSGDLSGYRWGRSVKAALLERETASG